MTMLQAWDMHDTSDGGGEGQSYLLSGMIQCIDTWVRKEGGGGGGGGAASTKGPLLKTTSIAFTLHTWSGLHTSITWQPAPGRHQWGGERKGGCF